MPAAARPAPSLTDFERRHEERFRGDAFDWYPFRQDGQRFPLPDPAERRTSEIFLHAADGSGSPRQLTRLGLSPGNLTWTPDGSAILFTANDAYMRELRIFAPADCIVSNTTADNDYALRQIARVMKGNVTASTRLAFLRRGSG